MTLSKESHNEKGVTRDASLLLFIKCFFYFLNIIFSLLNKMCIRDSLEATPAESTAYRFAKHDKIRYPDIITARLGEDGDPFYTNSSHLPVGYTASISEALDIQDEMQDVYKRQI